MKANNIKQDWITAAEWKAAPSVQWCENQRDGKIYIEQSKPLTAEEALAQMERLRN